MDQWHKFESYFLEDNIEENLHDIQYDNNFFIVTSKAQVTQGKTDKLNYNKM